ARGAGHETSHPRIPPLGGRGDGPPGRVLPPPSRPETPPRAVDEALAEEPPTDEPVTDTFGTDTGSLVLDALGPETVDLDWGPDTEAPPPSETPVSAELQPSSDEVSLAFDSPPSELPPDHLEAFDAGPLLEAEPEPESEPSTDDELLHALDESPPLVPGIEGDLEHTAPMLAVAAGAWSATTDDRLAPLRPGSSASALLEDIASEARAREDQARAAEEAMAEERRLREQAEALAELQALEAREAAAAARAARVDADEARGQAEAARGEAEAARSEAETARTEAAAARAAQHEAESARDRMQRVLDD